jgi:type III restriction enzyme
VLSCSSSTPRGQLSRLRRRRARELGPYGKLFEEEYRALAKHLLSRPACSAESSPSPKRAHDGYFSLDKKGRVTELEVNAAGELKNATARDDAERASS